MTRSVLLFFLSISSLVICFAQETEEDKVRESFEAYKAAILNDKGEEAVHYVDSRTLAYYTEILNKTKYADSATISSMGLMDKLMVFSIRHRVPKEKILLFDGEGLFVYAIQSGMVGKNSVANNSIGEVIIEQNFARGQFIASGQKAPFYFHFYKESNQWKVDLTSIFEISTMAFGKMQQDSGLDENEYLFSLLEMLTSKKPGSEIWDTIED